MCVTKRGLLGLEPNEERCGQGHGWNVSDTILALWFGLLFWLIFRSRWNMQIQNWMPTNFGFVGWLTFRECPLHLQLDMQLKRNANRENEKWERKSACKLIHEKIGNFVSLMVHYKLSIAHRTMLINLNKMVKPDAMHLLCVFVCGACELMRQRINNAASAFEFWLTFVPRNRIKFISRVQRDHLPCNNACQINCAH